MDKTQEQQNIPTQRVQQEPGNGGTATIIDNRVSTFYQQKLRATMDASTENSANPIQRKANKTGLPNNLKSGIENLSGYNMDDVKVYYNSSKPTQLQAHAYAQGTDIHLAPGQEKHLPHEAWHVVQQKQGRVKPTMQLKGKVNINDDAGLEREADLNGKKAQNTPFGNQDAIPPLRSKQSPLLGVYQMQFDTEGDINKLKKIHNYIKRIKTKPIYNEIEPDIYDILGFEENSEYEVQDGEEELVDVYGLKAQNMPFLIDMGIKIFKNEKEKKNLINIKNRYEKKIKRGDDIRYVNRLMYKNRGCYYHINRVYLKEFDEEVNERMIININKQEKAAELIMTIKDGWSENTNDWRAYVDSGKFYALNKNQKVEEQKLKYDKVVLYYDRRYQSRILEGVKNIVREVDRNPNISGFYNKISKGIGIGIENGGDSFTSRISAQLAGWICNDENWIKVCLMDEKEFVKEARDIVLRGMNLGIRLSYTGIEDVINNIYAILKVVKTKTNEEWIVKTRNKVAKILHKIGRDKQDLSKYEEYLKELEVIETEVINKIF